MAPQCHHLRMLSNLSRSGILCTTFEHLLRATEVFSIVRNRNASSHDSDSLRSLQTPQSCGSHKLSSLVFLFRGGHMKRHYFYIAVLALLLICVIMFCAAGRSGPAPRGASVTGVVKFKGTSANRAPSDMSAEPFCAQAHSAAATTEELLTDANGGLENVVVFVSDGLGTTAFTIPDEPAVMEQKGCQYKPHVLAMRAGQKLKVVNSDATTHNIHPMPNNNREWNVSQPHGVPVEQVFAREEVAISVKCNIHPWMRSYIAVVMTPSLF